MDVDAGQPLVLGHLQQGEEVIDVAVDAAIGQQAHEMQGAAPLPAVVHGLHESGVLEEVPGLDVPGDTGQVLEHHTACADVGVAHLAVAHLPLGQTHVQTGGLQAAAGAVPEDPVQIGLGGVGDGVARPRRGQAKAVHNDKGRWCFHK